MSASESLRSDFFRMAVFDETLAVALQNQCDVAIQGDFKKALKINQAISRRLELLTMAQTMKNAK